ncbi:MAG: DUF424 family protein [Candidatus Aenigmatarchaeota archaeon]
MAKPKNVKWSGLLRSKRTGFSYKIFKQDGNVLLAVADKNLLGKDFEQDELILSVPKNFYCDKSCDEKSVVREMKNATIINAVGKNVIALMLKKELISRDNILTVSGVPHAQVVKF